MQVYKHTCPGVKNGDKPCGYETWSDKGDKTHCSKCGTEYKTECIEFNNVFNIQTFLKEECKPYHVSKPMLAKSDEGIQTFMFIVANYALRKARKEKAKTILPSHFDWDIIEHFKLFMESRK